MGQAGRGRVGIFTRSLNRHGGVVYPPVVLGVRDIAGPGVCLKRRLTESIAITANIVT